MSSFGISATNALWLVLALMLIWMLYRITQKHENFLSDIFMNYSVSPPRADLTSIIIFIMALMFVWVCVKRTIGDKDVDNLVLGGLSIFVLRQAFKIGADAYASKPSAPEPEVPASRDINVNVAPSNPLASSKPVKAEIVNKEAIPVTETPPAKGKRGK